MNTFAEFNERTVGELAAAVPDSIRVFEAWKIDYCCGGKTPLPDACANAGKDVHQFVAELMKVSTKDSGGRDWTSESLASMSFNIVELYHVYTRQELQTIAPIAEKVYGVHGSRRPELAEVLQLIREASNDLIPHMLKEEQILFPYVDQLEKASTGSTAAPTPFFGTVKNPVRMMMMEHDKVGEILARLREVTDGYTPPESACFSYRELYRRLADLEKKTHEHIHVENNIYFPRAVALEEQIAEPVEFGAGGCGMHGCNH